MVVDVAKSREEIVEAHSIRSLDVRPYTCIVEQLLLRRFVTGQCEDTVFRGFWLIAVAYDRDGKPSIPKNPCGFRQGMGVLRPRRSPRS